MDHEESEEAEKAFQSAYRSFLKTDEVRTSRTPFPPPENITVAQYTDFTLGQGRTLRQMYFITGEVKFLQQRRRVLEQYLALTHPSSQAQVQGRIAVRADLELVIPMLPAHLTNANRPSPGTSDRATAGNPNPPASPETEASENWVQIGPTSPDRRDGSEARGTREASATATGDSPGSPRKKQRGTHSWYRSA